MTGFWAGSVPPWAALTGFCVCMLFLLAGAWWGVGRGERLTLEDLEREEAMARRTHPVYRQPPASDQFAAIREAGRQAWAIQQQRAADQQTAEELLHEWHDHPPLKWDDEGPSCKRRWEVEETDEEFSARMSAAADEIIAWAHAAATWEEQ